MQNNPENINELLDKLEALSKKQALFQKEINDLQAELYALKYARKTEQPLEEVAAPPILIEKPPVIEKVEIPQKQPEPIQKRPVPPITPQAPKQKSDIEKFIGEKLINIIGILILVIGVAIGAKYAIDNELISPLTRIILGYIVGIALMGFAITLKKNYLNFSAVLLSGAMAIMYFITYAAYSFYGLIPQTLAFGLMVLFTIFTVIAALNYEKQVIAHIGLVGAYAVPFLLSDGSGKVVIMFSYMAILNVGILAVAIKKYWKPLYYVAFSLTWLIYIAWFINTYFTSPKLDIAFSFLTIFFAIFYAAFLAYKLIQKEIFALSDVLMLLINSFIFYGLGYMIISKYPQGEQLLGLFTLGNAIVHFGVSALIYQQKLGDRNLFYLIIGLVLTFITIAIPVQLEGHWVVLLWSVEAALLFWLGRGKEVPFYEKLSYIMMFLAVYCLFFDWTSHYVWETISGVSTENTLKPIFNPQFLGSITFIAAFSFINYFHIKKPFATGEKNGYLSLMQIAIPAALLLAIYFTFHLEIANYFAQKYQASMLEIKTEEEYSTNFWNEDIRRMGHIWLINYALLFAIALSFANTYVIKARKLGILNMFFTCFAIFVFLLNGLQLLSELRNSYLTNELGQYYQHTNWNILLRYVSYIFVGGGLFSLYLYKKSDFMQPIEERFPVFYDIFLWATILWIGSTEFITGIEMMGYAQSFKLGLSIFWGVSALLLVILGMLKKKKHLRIAAMVLFGATLFKLFFYDLNNLSTIAKTVIFISLGVLLLLISFLYNKYKHVIFGEDEEG